MKAPSIDVTGLFDEAQGLHRAGRLSEARARYSQVLAAAPRHAPTLHMLGVMAYQVGQHDVAVDFLGQAAALDPMVPALHSNLGLALQGMGRIDAAAASLRRAVALAPDVAEAHNNLGNVMMQQGRVEAAAESFASAVLLNPGLAEAHANLGDALWSRGMLDEAEASHRRALALEPDGSEHLISLARLAAERGDASGALAYIRTALRRNETPRTRRIFADIVQQLHFDADDEEVGVLLARALAEAWTRPGLLAEAATSLIKLRLAGGARLEDDDLLRALLCATPNTDIGLERLLTAARRGVLERALAGEGADAGFAAALAQQCFLNDYVFALTADEAEAVQGLRTRIEAEPGASGDLATALACYLPLGELRHADALIADRAVLAQQRDEPRKERELGAAMPRLTPVCDALSEAVGRQYEENPYPRWRQLRAAVMPNSLGVYLRARFPFAGAMLANLPERPQILVAGCGTGQYALELTRDFFIAEVVAIDLSRASLAYAARKAVENGAVAVRFGQGDILQVAALNRSFDMIECGGVLHHMADPFAAWEGLLAQLRPGGLMRLSLYSATARRHIAAARDWIARHGFAATAEAIRASRGPLMAQSAFAPLLKTPDFYSISGCRDLLFHIQEHRLSLPEIGGFLVRNKLTLVGLEIGEATLAAYRARFPADPGAIDLDNWHSFEADHPDTFTAMYQFWVRRQR